MRLKEIIQTLIACTMLIRLIFLIMEFFDFAIFSSSDAARAASYASLACAFVTFLVFLITMKDAKTLLRFAASLKVVERLEKTVPEPQLLPPSEPVKYSKFPLLSILESTKPDSLSLEPQTASTHRVSKGGSEASSNDYEHLVPVSAGESTCRKLRLSDFVHR
jgi:hypothetical protein